MSSTQIEYTVEATWDGVWWIICLGNTDEEALEKADRKREYRKHPKRLVRRTVVHTAEVVREWTGRWAK